MEEEYLAPTEISFTTPFKKAFGRVGNGNDSYDGRSALNGNDSDLDFLDNFQNLNLSGRNGRLVLQEKEELEAEEADSNMGVAESKENVQEEIPSFVNFGDAHPIAHQKHQSPSPKSPIITSPVQVTPKKIRKPEFIEDVPVRDCPQEAVQFEETFAIPEVPIPKQLKLPVSESVTRQEVQPSPEPVLTRSKSPHPELKRLQDQLLQQEKDFLAQLAKQDELKQEKEQQLDVIYKKIEALQDQKEKPGKMKKYEAKIAALTTELQSLQVMLVQVEAANVEVINEREQYYADLRNVENAYTDLMGKYHRAMETMSSFRSIEDNFRSRDEDIQDKIEKRDHKYDVLKNQVQESVEAMYQEYDTKFVEKKHENENLRVRLMRLEMRVNTLENDLEQKTRENAQLHTLCDEIISGNVAR